MVLSACGKSKRIDITSPVAVDNDPLIGIPQPSWTPALLQLKPISYLTDVSL